MVFVLLVVDATLGNGHGIREHLQFQGIEMSPGLCKTVFLVSLFRVGYFIRSLPYGS